MIRPRSAVLLLALLVTGCGASSSQGPSQASLETTLPHPQAAPVPAPVPPPAPTTDSAHTVTAYPQPTTTTATTPAPAPAAGPPRPAIVSDPIPFGAQRRSEMTAYAMRHYGMSTYHLLDPHVIVIHYTETPDFQSTYNTFAPDTPDPELHELPNTCAHFVVGSDGTIHQLVALDVMCRHTVGLNWTAIGIEHVGYSDSQILGNTAQMDASLKLVRWLRCRFHIPVKDVIGHNESLSSPFHHENVPSLQTQTHGDFVRADMDTYRARLAAAGGCQ